MPFPCPAVGPPQALEVSPTFAAQITVIAAKSSIFTLLISFVSIPKLISPNTLDYPANRAQRVCEATLLLTPIHSKLCSQHSLGKPVREKSWRTYADGQSLTLCHTRCYNSYRDQKLSPQGVGRAFRHRQERRDTSGIAKEMSQSADGAQSSRFRPRGHGRRVRYASSPRDQSHSLQLVRQRTGANNL